MTRECQGCRASVNHGHLITHRHIRREIAPDASVVVVVVVGDGEICLSSDGFCGEPSFCGVLWQWWTVLGGVKVCGGLWLGCGYGSKRG